MIIFLIKFENQNSYEIIIIDVLQIIDLRWGIRDEAQDDHTTIDFCIREIENCKKSSIGPSFVVSICQENCQSW